MLPLKVCCHLLQFAERRWQAQQQVYESLEF